MTILGMEEALFVSVLGFVVAVAALLVAIIELTKTRKVLALLGRLVSIERQIATLMLSAVNGLKQGKDVTGILDEMPRLEEEEREVSKKIVSATLKAVYKIGPLTEGVTPKDHVDVRLETKK